MNKIVLAILIVFSMSNTTLSQPSPVSEFGDKLIAALQKKSFEDFRKLFISATDYSELLNDQINSFHIAGEELQELRKREKQFADSADNLFKQDFERLLTKAGKLGIDWQLAKKEEWIFKESKPDNSSKKFISGHLNFSCNDTLFVIFGIEAIKFSSGYKLSEIRTILKGGIGEYVDPDLLDDEDL